ncbi:ATP synthase F1 subunit epsilon [Filifactor villosus]|uniref:ATP synthase epsilon chain n=1 Tax=Filifactor villosus TaxID=29374 RepID=A0ABV9QJQ6_9FIRM
MATFRLHIVTPEGTFHDDEIDLLVVRTSEGNVGIKKHHIDYVAKVDIGKIEIIKGKQKTYAAITDGILLVDQEKTTILTRAAERPEDIDMRRAEEAKQRAEKVMQSCKRDDIEYKIAELKLKKALNRIDLKKNP